MRLDSWQIGGWVPVKVVVIAGPLVLVCGVGADLRGGAEGAEFAVCRERNALLAVVVR